MTTGHTAGNGAMLAGLAVLVCVLGLAPSARAETCVPLEGPGGPAGTACLIENFTPSHPLTSYAPYRFRLPADVSVFGGTLLAAGPPGGVSTWGFAAPAIARGALAADGTLELGVGGVRPASGESVHASLRVAAESAVPVSKLTIRAVGHRRVCRGRPSKRSCRRRPRRIVVTLRFRSSIALTTPIQANLTGWRKGKPVPPKLLRRERVWRTGPGTRTLRLVFAAGWLERRCARIRHCALGAGAAHFATDAERTLVVTPQEGLQARLRIK